MKRNVSLGLALILAGCGDYLPDSATTSIDAREENGFCPATLFSGGAPGWECTTSADCGEVCCSCPDSGSFAASACINGYCANFIDVCLRALDSYSTVCL